jgi:hypothetical protein
MATIKSYTDLEQSKKLAEFLPLESADMFYRDNGVDVKLMWEHNAQKVTNPCWSLAALLSVLPNDLDNTTTLSKGGWSLDTMKYVDKWFVEYEKEVGGKEFTTSADNSIDACVAMIEKLHEQNIM